MRQFMRQFKCPECYHTGELADFEKIHINGDTCVLCPECKAKYNVSELIKLDENGEEIEDTDESMEGVTDEQTNADETIEIDETEEDGFDFNDSNFEEVDETDEMDIKDGESTEKDDEQTSEDSGEEDTESEESTETDGGQDAEGDDSDDGDDEFVDFGEESEDSEPDLDGSEFSSEEATDIKEEDTEEKEDTDNTDEPTDEEIKAELESKDADTDDGLDGLDLEFDDDWNDTDEDEMYYGGYDNKEDEQKKLVKQVEKMQQQISNTSGHVGGLSDHPLKHRNGGDKMDTGIISKIRESLTDNRDCDLAINILKEIGKFVEDGGEVKCSMRVVFSLLGTDFVELAYRSDREIMLRASGFNEDVTNMWRIVYESPFEKSSIRIERFGRIE